MQTKKMTKRIETERKGKSLDKTYKGTDQSSDSMKRHSCIHATSTHSLSNHPVQVSMIHAAENQLPDNTPGDALRISRSERLGTEGKLPNETSVSRDSSIPKVALADSQSSVT